MHYYDCIKNPKLHQEIFIRYMGDSLIIITLILLYIKGSLYGVKEGMCT